MRSSEWDSTRTVTAMGRSHQRTTDLPRPITAPPAELTALLEAPDDQARDVAWTRLVDRCSRLILHTIHGRADGYDPTMDRYAFILQRLREDDFRRLRSFAADGRGQFSTWLVRPTPRTAPPSRDET